ncbi:hypothetical protein [Anaerocolumna xylanovorans]|uniref:Uncharacterized protein n=1 Tax=Anaerocolumna xylanovorans DSM 12503 TaxID=1121345 RepID=A0A1M7YK85_9FIRM|nr:hypothetical protein [Anaerocolumna xylanovorans]SHO53033.1 hypothetical protein SAMN02745217_03926 [Anaerocolumna xylanovorans DSM 12503]
MKINENRLDEMQKEKRNSIGNQMFMLMFYALLLDSGLYGGGIRWLPYPSNIMVIIMACMGIYLIRIIGANAYLPPRTDSKKTVISSVIAVIFSVVLVVAAFWLFKSLSGSSAPEASNDNSALILFIVSATGLFISLIVAVIKRANEKDKHDE